MFSETRFLFLLTENTGQWANPGQDVHVERVDGGFLLRDAGLSCGVEAQQRRPGDEEVRVGFAAERDRSGRFNAAGSWGRAERLPLRVGPGGSGAHVDDAALWRIVGPLDGLLGQAKRARLR